MYTNQGAAPYMVQPGARLDIGPRGGLYETLGNPGIEVLWSPPVRMAAGVAMAYHGYKRTKSVGWALLWSIFGSAMPFFAVPVSLAQGFSKPKARR